MIWLWLACTSQKGDTASTQETVSVNGLVRDLLTQDPISGVSVCLLSNSEVCTESMTTGAFTIEQVPSESNVGITFVHEDYYSGVIAVNSAIQDLAPVDLGSDAIISSQFGLMGIEQQPNTGIIVFSVSNGIAGDGINIEGATVDISSGDGPFYTNSTGLPSSLLTATSSHGGGVIANLEPGEYEMNYGNLPQNCGVLLGWGTPQMVQTVVVAEHVAYVRLECGSVEAD